MKLFFTFFIDKISYIPLSLFILLCSAPLRSISANFIIESCSLSKQIDTELGFNTQLDQTSRHSKPFSLVWLKILNWQAMAWNLYNEFRAFFYVRYWAQICSTNIGPLVPRIQAPAVEHSFDC